MTNPEPLFDSGDRDDADLILLKDCECGHGLPAHSRGIACSRCDCRLWLPSDLRRLRERLTAALKKLPEAERKRMIEAMYERLRRHAGSPQGHAGRN